MRYTDILAERVGMGKAVHVFGGELRNIIQELNEALVA